MSTVYGEVRMRVMQYRNLFSHLHSVYYFVYNIGNPCTYYVSDIKMFDYMKDPDNRIIVSKLPANAVSGSGCCTVGNFAREIFLHFR